MVSRCKFRLNKINIDSHPKLKICIENALTIIYWLLQIRVIVVVFIALTINTWIIYFFLHLHGIYNYPHIPAELLEAHLYKQRSPKLVRHQSKPDCIYHEILNNTDSRLNWEATKKIDDFSANGLVNGSYAPEHCNALFSVAVIVAYKKRQRQLDIFVPYIHNFLRKQNIHYRLYIVEQQDKKVFNKGVLYNVGVKTAMGHKFPCVILHDVDLLPLDASNLYVCTNDPRHMSASIDKFRFILPYEELIGGVTAMKIEHYVALDGYSNRFEGWGGEDDDFYRRLPPQKMNLIRFPIEMSRYTMMTHPQEEPNEWRFYFLRDNVKECFKDSGERYFVRGKDGLSTLPLVSARISNHPLFTLVGVKL